MFKAERNAAKACQVVPAWLGMFAKFDNLKSFRFFFFCFLEEEDPVEEMLTVLPDPTYIIFLKL